MTNLADKHCEVCRSGAPPIDAIEAKKLMTTIPGWRIELDEGIEKLTREYGFASFQSALDFTSKVGALAELEQHHPSMLTEWGKVTVYWWTHKIKGLHLNDFIMAAKTDLIADHLDQD